MKARLPKSHSKQNINDMMKQAQMMQAQMEEKQEELQDAEHTITAGGGMIELTMLGNHQVKSIKINPEIVDAEDVEMLEDMVAAAVNEAVRVVDESSEKELGAISGKYNIPGI